MKIQRCVYRSAICLTQVGLLALSNVSVVLAAGSSLDARLDALDKQVFGESHQSLSQSARLKALEVTLFGSEKTGSMSTRVQEISKALEHKGGDLLLPPMAPQLDSNGSTLSSASKSGSNGSQSTASNDTAPGEASPVSKQLLRSAMQAYTQGHTDDAERLFHQVLGVDKKNVDAYYNLGVIAESRNDYQSALNFYRSASRLAPSDSEFSDAVNTVQNKLQDQVASNQHQQQQQQEASSEAAEQQKVSNLKGYVNEAAAAYKAGNYDKAISNLRYVAAQAPQDPDVEYALGQAYKAKGNIISARSALQQAVSIEPDNQLYKNALNELERVANTVPPTAPDHNARPGQLTSFDSGANSSSASPTPFSAQSANGGVTPFTGMDDFASRGAPYNQGGGSGLASGMLGGGLGSMLMGGARMMSGMGGMGGGMGMGMPMGMGMGMGSGMPMGMGYRGYMGTGTRIKRVAVGSLGGAAVGAIYGASTHSGAKRGAMTGALMGGVMSLFTGF